MNRYSLSFVKSGGIAGIYKRIDVDSATGKILLWERVDTTPSVATLTAGELAAITEALRAANIPRTRGPHRCGICADQFLYDLTLRIETAVYNVHWEDGSGAPEALFKLGAVLLDVASGHLRGPVT